MLWQSLPETAGMFVGNALRLEFREDDYRRIRGSCVLLRKKFGSNDL